MDIARMTGFMARSVQHRQTEPHRPLGSAATAAQQHLTQSRAVGARDRSVLFYELLGAAARAWHRRGSHLDDAGGRHVDRDLGASPRRELEDALAIARELGGGAGGFSPQRSRSLRL